MSAARAVTATFTAAAVDPCTPVTYTFPGVVNGTLAAASCAFGTFPTGNVYPSTIYRFTTTGATATNLAIASTFTTPGLNVMSDPPVAGNDVGWFSTSGNLSLTYLLPAGSYQARVSGQSATVSNFGNFTLTGTQVGFSNTSCDTRTLLLSITLTTQTLATTDCAVASNGTYSDWYVVKSQKPCTIIMQSTALDTFLQVQDAITNAVIAFNDNSSGTNSQISLATCANGTNPIYIIALSNPTPALTGAYTLTFTLTGVGSIVEGGRPSMPILFPNSWLDAAGRPKLIPVKKQD
jgi:hypothetical protein